MSKQIMYGSLHLCKVASPISTWIQSLKFSVCIGRQMSCTRYFPCKSLQLVTLLTCWLHVNINTCFYTQPTYPHFQEGKFEYISALFPGLQKHFKQLTQDLDESWQKPSSCKYSWFSFSSFDLDTLLHSSPTFLKLQFWYSDFFFQNK